MNSEQQTVTMSNPHHVVISTPITQQRWTGDHNLDVGSASTIAATPSDSHLSIHHNEMRLAKGLHPQKRVDSPTPNGPISLEPGIANDIPPDLDGKNKVQNLGPIPSLSKKSSPPRNHAEPSHTASKPVQNFDNGHPKIPQYGPLPTATPLQLHAAPLDRSKHAEAILESVFGRSVFAQGGSR